MTTNTPARSGLLAESARDRGGVCLCRRNRYAVCVLGVVLVAFGSVGWTVEIEPASRTVVNRHLLWQIHARPLRFAVLPDRTGGHRAGVFEEGMRLLNLLRPDFVVSLGDLIEGYSGNAEVVAQKWDDVLGHLEGLEMPVFLVPGNHDVYGQLKREEWRDRFGRLFYHFTIDNILFLCLDTEDPDGVDIGPEQIAYAQRVLEQYRDAAWTFVFMHEPLWIFPENSEWGTIEKMLKGLPHTVFAGHLHEYTLYKRNDARYFQMATMGGARAMRGLNFGELDHVAWVTLGADGPPVVANVLLDGVWDETVRTEAFGEQIEELAWRAPAAIPPVFVGEGVSRAVAQVHCVNRSEAPMNVHIQFAPSEDWSFEPAVIEADIPAGAAHVTEAVLFARTAASALDATPVPADWLAVYAFPGRPSFEREGCAHIYLSSGEDALRRASSAEDLRRIVRSLFDAGFEDRAADWLNTLIARASDPDVVRDVLEIIRIMDEGGALAPRLGFVTDWLLLGPFPWSPEDGFERPAIDMADAAPGRGVEIDGRAYTWQPHSAREEDLGMRRASRTYAGRGIFSGPGLVNLQCVFGGQRNACAYGLARIAMREDMDAIVCAGSDDGIKVWVNGDALLERDVVRSVLLDQDRAVVRLCRGVNTIVVQATQLGEGWAFCLRLTRPDGTPLPIG